MSKNNENNVHNAKKKVNNNLVSQGVRFKAHVPENVVDHVHNVLVQDVLLLEEGTALGAVEKTTLKRECECNGQSELLNIHAIILAAAAALLDVAHFHHNTI